MDMEMEMNDIDILENLILDLLDGKKISNFDLYRALDIINSLKNERKKS